VGETRGFTAAFRSWGEYNYEEDSIKSS